MQSDQRNEDAGAAQTRDRIRDAAVLRFARDGFGVGLRRVAEDAGVTAPLILHYFGSKVGLRTACDEHVLAQIRELKAQALVPGDTQALLLQMASLDESAHLLGYSLRSLQAGGDMARAFIEQFAADAEVYTARAVADGEILPSRDEKARARYLTVQGFGTLLLDLTLNPPSDPTDFVGALHAYMDRMMLPAVELFTQGLMGNRRMLDAYLLYVGDPPGTDSGTDTSES